MIQDDELTWTMDLKATHWHVTLWLSRKGPWLVMFCVLLHDTTNHAKSVDNICNFKYSIARSRVAHLPVTTIVDRRY